MWEAICGLVFQRGTTQKPANALWVCTHQSEDMETALGNPHIRPNLQVLIWSIGRIDPARACLKPNSQKGLPSWLIGDAYHGRCGDYLPVSHTSHPSKTAIWSKDSCGYPVTSRGT